nr:immunoglobulin heavy chain junction region [Macaca mulatta]MOX91739.1 immunoglobulin heavy chain junction region [Macaca mulatta]MOX91816.1 immunoglobulin heavy chain junction region [Macaca mulatta]MOX91975.1 immunoglobulin heavy chain junction region [Macaca mulatta]MOX92072.1 immunoglobulin heavy chain junction region [Macaca mulatta]
CARGTGVILPYLDYW